MKFRSQNFSVWVGLIEIKAKLITAEWFKIDFKFKWAVQIDEHQKLQTSLQLKKERQNYPVKKLLLEIFKAWKWKAKRIGCDKKKTSDRLEAGWIIALSSWIISQLRRK